MSSFEQNDPLNGLHYVVFCLKNYSLNKLFSSHFLLFSFIFAEQKKQCYNKAQK